MDSLLVKVIRARNIPTNQDGTLKKVFVRINFEIKAKTPIFYDKRTASLQSLTPQWDETFSFDCKLDRKSFPSVSFVISLINENSNEELGTKSFSVIDLVQEFDGIDKWNTLEGTKTEIYLNLTLVSGTKVDSLNQKSKEDVLLGSMLSDPTQNKPQSPIPGSVSSTLVNRILLVTVVSGRNLIAIDNTSNPFCTLQLFDINNRPIKESQYKTKVMKDNLNPEWNEIFTFQPTVQISSLKVSVSDEDDPMGEVIIPTSELITSNGSEVWYPLKPSKLKEDVSGDLCLKILPKDNDLGNFETNVLHLEIVSGKNLSTKPINPYVSIALLDSAKNEIKGTRKETPFIKGNFNPIWNQKFEFQSQNVLSMKLEVWDKNTIFKDSLLGEYEISAKDLIKGDNKLKTLILKPNENVKEIIIRELTIRYFTGATPPPSPLFTSKTKIDDTKSISSSLPFVSSFPPFGSAVDSSKTIDQGEAKKAKLFLLSIPPFKADTTIKTKKENINPLILPPVSSVGSSSNPALPQEQANLKEEVVEPSNTESKELSPKPNKGEKSSLENKTLFISIVSGRNLVATDLNGTSDPFCVLQLFDINNRLINDGQFKTKVVKKNNLNPQWNETFTYEPTVEISSLKISVFDEDTVGNDCMGEITIQTSELVTSNGSEVWYPLKPSKLNEDVSGDLCLKIIAKDNASIDFDNSTLYLEVVSGKNLSTKPINPYVSITLLDSAKNEIKGTRKETPFIKGNFNPIWNQKFEFQSQNVLSMKLEVWDKNTIFKDICLGECEILAKDLIKGDNTDKYLSLKPCGSIKLNITGELTVRYYAKRISPPVSPFASNLVQTASSQQGFTSGVDKEPQKDPATFGNLPSQQTEKKLNQENENSSNSGISQSSNSSSQSITQTKSEKNVQTEYPTTSNQSSSINMNLSENPLFDSTTKQEPTKEENQVKPIDQGESNIKPPFNQSEFSFEIQSKDDKDKEPQKDPATFGNLPSQQTEKKLNQENENSSNSGISQSSNSSSQSITQTKSETNVQTESTTSFNQTSVFDANSLSSENPSPFKPSTPNLSSQNASPVDETVKLPSSQQVTSPTGPSIFSRSAPNLPSSNFLGSNSLFGLSNVNSISSKQYSPKEELSLIEIVNKLNQKIEVLAQQVKHTNEDLRSEISQLRLELKSKNQLLSRSVGETNIFEIDYEEIEKGKKIGKGGYGVVYGGKLKKNNSLIFLKELEMESQSSQMEENLKRELEIMYKLNHPNITKLIGICEMKDRSKYVVLEYLIKSSLYHQLHENSIKIPLWLQIKLSIDILKGISYLHQSNPKLIHRDLKSQNVLLDSNWNVKLDIPQVLIDNSKDPQWMAPEILEEGNITEKSDIYSFGMVLYEISTNLIPFKGLNQVQVIAQLLKNKRPTLPNNCEPKLKEIVTRCWERNPSLRPSSIQLLAQFELLFLESKFQPVKEEYISSEWDFTPDFLFFNGSTKNNPGWKSKENFRFFRINVNSLTSQNYEIDLDYCLNNTIEYCEWNKFENLCKKHHYTSLMNNELQLSILYAIQNDSLNSKFKSILIKYENELEMNPQLSEDKPWEGDDEKWKDWILEQFKSLSSQFPNQNGLNNSIKIIPLFYFLTNEELGWKICSQGFNLNENSALLENGWMGKGIYFSSNLEYLFNIHDDENRYECNSNEEYSILVCYVLIHKLYPCIQPSDNSKSNYPCHFSLVRNGTSFSSSSPVVCKENESKLELKKSITHFAIYNSDHILPKYLLRIKKPSKIN